MRDPQGFGALKEQVAVSVFVLALLGCMAYTITQWADSRQALLLAPPQAPAPPSWSEVGRMPWGEHSEWDVYGRFIPDPGVVCYTVRASGRVALSCVTLPEGTER